MWIKYSLQSIMVPRNTDIASPPLRDETVCARQCILCDPEMTPGSHVMGASMNGTPQRKWLCNTQVTRGPPPLYPARYSAHTNTYNVPAALGATLFSIRGILGDFSELPRRQMKLARTVVTEWPLWKSHNAAPSSSPMFAMESPAFQTSAVACRGILVLLLLFSPRCSPPSLLSSPPSLPPQKDLTGVLFLWRQG